jgi:pimeloyl-ACP methyl ester carboxylesterase
MPQESQVTLSRMLYRLQGIASAPGTGAVPASDNPQALGEIIRDVHKHQLRYYPPLEFNEQQRRDAQGNIALTRARLRHVEVHIDSQTRSGEPFEGRAIIALARPVVVLVHGVNNNSLIWRGTQGIGLGKSLAAWDFEAWAVEHGGNDLDLSQPGKSGALYFKGNGPVEFAAVRVKNTIQAALKARNAAGLVTNRVDVVGHSYGGVVSRWYIHSNPAPAPQVPPSAPPPTSVSTPKSLKLDWYTNSVNHSPETGIYQLPVALYNGEMTLVHPDNNYHSVRKLITIGSPWRGTPIANIVNETHEAPLYSGKNLSKVKLGLWRVRPLTMQTFIDKHLPVPGKAPSFEVNAVESPWLRTLNARPFNPEIAYDALAGTNNAYIATGLPKMSPLPYIDLFTTLCEALPRDVLPVLEKERLEKRWANLTDGLIPVWSAVIEPRSRLVPASHNALLWNDDAKTYISGALSDAGLTSGSTLNAQWKKGWTYTMPLPSEADLPPGQHSWSFDNRHMAPLDRADAYQQYQGVARINPDYIYPS